MSIGPWTCDEDGPDCRNPHGCHCKEIAALLSRRAPDAALSAEVADVEEALRLCEVGEYLYSSRAYSYGDGRTEPREFGIDWQWQQSRPDEYGQGVLLSEAVKWHEDMAENGIISEAMKLRATITTFSAEVERLRNEADGEFVAAAVRVMRANPGFDHRDYQDGITADDFEMFFTEDMNEAWRLHEKERARAEAAEARVAELRDLLLLVRPLLSWAPPGAGGAECMFTIDAALSHTKEG